MPNLLFLVAFMVMSQIAFAKPIGHEFDGIASYYHNSLHGNLTSNGEIYDKNSFTCAHKTLPINTVVSVTNLENGITTYCRINDRGPFVDGRVIDMSFRAAEDLKMVKNGIVEVSVEIQCVPNKGSSRYGVKTPSVTCMEEP